MKRSMYASGVLFLLLAVAMIVAGTSARPDGAAPLVLVGLLFLPCAGAFFWVGSWGVLDNGQLRDRSQLERFGRPAPAVVLQSEGPLLGAGGEGGARVTIRVSPANESPFKAKVTLPADRATPAPGEPLHVKFDPNKRKSVIVVGSPPASGRVRISGWP